eukprot:EG_transcript_23631
MTKIVQINTSPKLSGSESTKLANKIVARLKELHPLADFEVRDLAAEPHPTLDAGGFAALFTPVEDRSEEQLARAAADDVLIEQLKSADILVFGVPMYNFNVSTQFKSWIDAVVKAGVTFNYTSEGSVGLLSGKKAYFALTRGGYFRDTPNDVLQPWLKIIFSVIGITDLHFIYLEGLTRGGPESVAKGWSVAEEEIRNIV